MKEALDHFGDGVFLGGAVSDDGLFDFSRRDFVDVQAGLGHDGQGRAPRLAQGEGGLQVLGVEKALNGADGGMVLGGDFPQRLGDFQKAPA